MQDDRPIYLDCNATTPIDPRVRDAVLHFMTEEFGNSGSRTHEYGARAKQAVERARDQVAQVAGASREDVIFTSGATESNNLALLGLAAAGEESGKKHVISSVAEHKAVLEPLESLARRGFEVTLLPCDEGGRVAPQALKAALRADTLLVSLMHVNNETGVEQDLQSFVDVLREHPAFFHVDAAQSFGKIPGAEHARIDLVSASSHKLYGPKGVGALIARRRGFHRAPLRPITFGGGQERGLRPGTLPVPLIVGFGLACDLAHKERETRLESARKFRDDLLTALAHLDPQFNGDAARCIPFAVNMSFLGIDSEALMVALKTHIAVSNGSACTSHSYSPSHVLKAMGLDADRISSAIRISWCHSTPRPPWGEVARVIEGLRN